MHLRNLLTLTAVSLLIATGFTLSQAAFLPASAETAPAQGAQDFEVQARLRMEQALREKSQQDLKEATEELRELTEALAERVALADGYTTDARILDYSTRVEEMAKRIEDLAKTINRRARGR